MVRQMKNMMPVTGRLTESSGRFMTGLSGLVRGRRGRVSAAHHDGALVLQKVGTTDDEGLTRSEALDDLHPVTDAPADGDLTLLGLVAVGDEGDGLVGALGVGLQQDAGDRDEDDVLALGGDEDRKSVG